jgi:hypothetical protein
LKALNIYMPTDPPLGGFKKLDDVVPRHYIAGTVLQMYYVVALVEKCQQRAVAPASLLPIVITPLYPLLFAVSL